MISAHQMPPNSNIPRHSTLFNVFFCARERDDMACRTNVAACLYRYIPRTPHLSCAYAYASLRSAPHAPPRTLYASRCAVPEPHCFGAPRAIVCMRQLLQHAHPFLAHSEHLAAQEFACRHEAENDAQRVSSWKLKRCALADLHLGFGRTFRCRFPSEFSKK